MAFLDSLLSFFMIHNIIYLMLGSMSARASDALFDPCHVPGPAPAASPAPDPASATSLAAVQAPATSLQCPLAPETSRWDPALLLHGPAMLLLGLAMLLPGPAMLLPGPAMLLPGLQCCSVALEPEAFYVTIGGSRCGVTDIDSIVGRRDSTAGRRITTTMMDKGFVGIFH